ncbi:hypothetical protein [Mesorhizobium sp.]|uniref:hypothetical protein n=1 Tax=Mesorhizobium sp. TaxID=1871066 RepID=UPI0025F4C906|nr:hypothetical protein [Mesorhizobium sp.]
MAAVVLQRVQAVRIRGDDAVEAAGADRVDVGLGKRFEQALLAGAPHVVAAVALGIEENAEIDAGGGDKLGDLARQVLDARVVGCVVADEPQHVDRFAARVLDWEAELLGPARAHLGRLAHRIPEPSEVGQRFLEHRAEMAFVDKMAPHVDDLGQMLDLDRTGLHAGAAGRAGPERLLGDQAADQRKPTRRSPARRAYR